MTSECTVYIFILVILCSY